ncbi:DUF6207 family protein [Streptomyces niveus]|uniref:DUF6207 family protein n=1 Tax=Streptomyces niveus TaxID=193462 RepID=UPI0036F04332
MDPIDTTQIPEPSLVVLDLTAHDEATAHAVMEVLDRMWATSGITPVRRDPGVPGARARVRADTRRSGTQLFDASYGGEMQTTAVVSHRPLERTFNTSSYLWSPVRDPARWVTIARRGRAIRRSTPSSISRALGT